jgi:RHS repeat-associated protein
LDDLGNRANVNVRDGNDITYTVDDLTNRYTSVADVNLTYDAAGNLTKDKDSYEYKYDYENRIVKITKDGNDIAEFAYDALGRRIQKKDLIDPNNTRRYYHNYKWQVLAEYDDNDTIKNIFVYGNYIDEVLYRPPLSYYVHDHLYSPVALVSWIPTVIERYEYDAYGNPTIWNADFTTERDSSNYGNPYLFTGRRVDILDSGSLKIQYNRNRYYDYYSGRWLTHDPLDFVDGMNRYEYVRSNPIIAGDPSGLKKFEELLDYHYMVGSNAPEDGEWEHGKWDRAVPPLSQIPTLLYYWHLAHVTALGGDTGLAGVRTEGTWESYPDAARHLLHYINNTGEKLDTDFTRLLSDSEQARDTFWWDLRMVMGQAEQLLAGLPDPSLCATIVQKGHNKNEVTESSRNWWYAIQHYYTWGRGTVRKGKGRKSCCYYMTWTNHLRDNYEFEDHPTKKAGLVYDKWMWELNKYGWAQHFKIRAEKTLHLVWIRKFRYKKKEISQLNRGWRYNFPQCE